MHDFNFSFTAGGDTGTLAKTYDLCLFLYNDSYDTSVNLTSYSQNTETDKKEDQTHSTKIDYLVRFILGSDATQILIFTIN